MEDLELNEHETKQLLTYHPEEATLASTNDILNVNSSYTDQYATLDFLTQFFSYTVPLFIFLSLRSISLQINFFFISKLPSYSSLVNAICTVENYLNLVFTPLIFAVLILFATLSSYSSTKNSNFAGILFFRCLVCIKLLFIPLIVLFYIFQNPLLSSLIYDEEILQQAEIYSKLALVNYFIEATLCLSFTFLIVTDNLLLSYTLIVFYLFVNFICSYLFIGKLNWAAFGTGCANMMTLKITVAAAAFVIYDSEQITGVSITQINVNALLNTLKQIGQALLATVILFWSFDAVGLFSLFLEDDQYVSYNISHQAFGFMILYSKATIVATLVPVAKLMGMGKTQSCRKSTYYLMCAAIVIGFVFMGANFPFTIKLTEMFTSDKVYRELAKEMISLGVVMFSPTFVATGLVGILCALNKVETICYVGFICCFLFPLLMGYLLVVIAEQGAKGIFMTIMLSNLMLILSYSSQLMRVDYNLIKLEVIGRVFYEMVPVGERTKKKKENITFKV